MRSARKGKRIMGYKVDNAIIMAAGCSNRFAPLSYEKPKALIDVRGEILIERQIRQLLEAGIKTIVLVTGYKQEQFYYLKDKFGLILIENKDYSVRNNHSSIYAARDYLKNTYICSSDNYFTHNPFEPEVEAPYYAAVFAPGKTDEWCLQTDADDYITGIRIGGERQWYMLGHVFWNGDFSRRFLRILEDEYNKAETIKKLWEDIYREHIDQLRLKIRRYDKDQIYEFDSLDELRLFDEKYRTNSGSAIMAKLSGAFQCPEGSITELKPLKDPGDHVIGVIFSHDHKRYQFLYKTEKIMLVSAKADRWE